MVGIRILALSLLLAIPALVAAQTQTITVTHTYMMGDNDSKNDARQMCFLEAKRKVLEKAGSYIESRAEVSMSQLTRDQVRSYSAAVVNVEIAKEEFAFENGHNTLTLTVKANVDMADVKQRLEAISKDKQLQDQISHQQQQLARLEERVADLRRQLAEPRQQALEPHTQEQVLELRRESTAAFDSIAEVIQAARERIARGNEGRKAMCGRLLRGMTRAEVAAVVGNPTDGKGYMLTYGTEKRITISFDMTTGEAQFIYGCEYAELRDGQEQLRAIQEQAKRDADALAQTYRNLTRDSDEHTNNPPASEIRLPGH